jgi:hypothetical protein
LINVKKFLSKVNLFKIIFCKILETTGMRRICYLTLVLRNFEIGDFWILNLRNIDSGTALTMPGLFKTHVLNGSKRNTQMGLKRN